MGFLAFISVPGLQIYAMSQSKNISKESSMMLSSLNISSFNLGIFLGSYIGQLTVAHISLQATGLVGTGILIISSIVTFYLWKNEKIAV